MPSTILIVEDDKDIRRNMHRLLKSEGYSVVLAEHGQAALDYLNDATILPNLIILDLMMPIMDGFQFRVIQEADCRFSSIPVVIMTADGHLEEKRMKTAARDAIRKPADVETILRVIRQLC